MMRKVFCLLATAIVATACSQSQHSKKTGFLTKEELPNAVEILPEHLSLVLNMIRMLRLTNLARKSARTLSCVTIACAWILLI